MSDKDAGEEAGYLRGGFRATFKLCRCEDGKSYPADSTKRCTNVNVFPETHSVECVSIASENASIVSECVFIVFTQAGAGVDLAAIGWVVANAAAGDEAEYLMGGIRAMQMQRWQFPPCR